MSKEAQELLGKRHNLIIFQLMLMLNHRLIHLFSTELNLVDYDFDRFGSNVRSKIIDKWVTEVKLAK